MRKLIVACGLLAATLALFGQSPSIRVQAQEQPNAPRPKMESQGATAAESPRKVSPTKEANIRQLMEITGAKNLGDQMMKAGIDQFRASVTESQPDNPRAKQFVEAFVVGFQKHFDVSSLSNKVVPIYDKYLSEEDVKDLVAYYQSPLGQRMLKALPEIARESQEAGFAMGEKAAQQTFEDLKADYPEFITTSDDEKHPAGERKEPN
jgi:uncharacterized protein